MVTLINVIGGLYLAFCIPGALLLHYAWVNRNEVGGQPLFLGMSGVIGWTVLYGFSLIFNDQSFTVAAVNLEFIFVDITSIGVFWLSLEYFTKKKIQIKRISPLFSIVVLDQIFVWTNQIHHLVRKETTTFNQGMIIPDFGLWFYIHVALTYFLLVTGVLVLFYSLLNSRGVFKKQVLAMLIGLIIGIGSSAIYVFELVPVQDLDITPIGALIAILFFELALFRYQFLETVPVARQLTMEKMEDSVLTINENGIVVDTNPSAEEVFGLETESLGNHISEVLDDYPELVEEISGKTEAETEVSVRGKDEMQHFHLNISPITEGGRMIGNLIVLRDISELKKREEQLRNREEELELMKDVQNRFLRHNMRNELNVIQGYAELLKNDADRDDIKNGEWEDILETINGKTEKLIESSAKARQVEKVIDESERRKIIDIGELVQDIVRDLKEKNPDVEFEVENSDELETEVEVTGHLDKAVRNVIQNSIEHNDSNPKRVRVTVENSNDWIVICVSDNGPGIPQHEINVIEQREETKLKHSSGIGLWLVDWIIEKSGGEIEFNVDESGTDVILRLPKE